MKNRIVQIEFPLPFFIPIEEGLQVVKDYHNIGVFKFSFSKYKNRASEANSELEDNCTLISMEYMTNLDGLDERDTQNLVRVAVRDSIIYLNNFLDGFRLISDLNFVRNFSITDLPPIIEIEIGDDKIKYATTPTTLLKGSKELGIEEVTKVQSRVSVWDNHQYFEVIDKFLSKAIHHLYTEEFLYAIVELQTSFESYIRLCHNLILVKNGADTSKIEAAKEYPLKNTIIDHIGRALGEDFDFDNNPVISLWCKKLYSLRNSIVHSGLSYISGDEAYEAYDSLELVVNYINTLMSNEGYMDAGGNVEISKLNKNTPADVDFDKAFNELKNRGFI